MIDDDAEGSGLLIDLDSLFDTRLGLMAILDDKEVLEKNYGEGYFARERDVFSGIDEKDWYRLYGSRDKKVLKNAQITPMIGFIREFIYETLAGNVNTPQLLKPFVHVNTWPYQLLEQEQAMILQGLIAHVGTKADIQIVHLDPKLLTPVYVNTNYSMLVMYEYEKWLAAHFSNSEAITKTCPDVGLIGPRVLREGSSVVTKVDDVFSITEQRMEVFVKLKHLPIEMFSTIATPQRMKEAYEAALRAGETQSTTSEGKAA